MNPMCRFISVAKLVKINGITASIGLIIVKFLFCSYIGFPNPKKFRPKISLWSMWFFRAFEHSNIRELGDYDH